MTTYLGTKVKVIVLGSKDHFNALQEAINEYQLKSHTLKLKILNQQAPLDEKELADLNQEIKTLETLKSQREDELAFMKANCPNQNEEVDNDSEDNNFSITSDEVFGRSDTLATTSSSTIHVTSETFGELKQLVLIKHKHSEDLWQKPVARQYFVGKTLHREEEEYRVQYIELFNDLIYVGCFGKTGYLVAEKYTWITFLEVCLVILPVLYRWKQQTAVNNMIHHSDLSQKIYSFLCSAVIVLMATTIGNSWALDAATNTGNVFIALHLIGGLLVDIYLLLFSCVFNPQFRFTMLVRLVPNVLYLIPYCVLFGYPANGTYERYTTRLWIWGFGNLIELLIPLLFMLVIPLINNPKATRVAVNIEHMCERHSLLIVIVLGEFVLHILTDFSLDQPVSLLLNVILGFLNSLCLYYLYFRAETNTHHKHALRRSAYSGILWGLIHIPLSVFIVSLSIAIYAIIKEAAYNITLQNMNNPIAYQLQTIFGVSYSMVFFSFCILTLVHADAAKTKTNRKTKKALIAKKTRLLGKFLTGVLFLIFCLTVSWSAQTWLIVTTILSVFSVAVEEVGRTKHKCKTQ